MLRDYFAISRDVGSRMRCSRTVPKHMTSRPRSGRFLDSRAWNFSEPQNTEAFAFKTICSTTGYRNISSFRISSDLIILLDAFKSSTSDVSQNLAIPYVFNPCRYKGFMMSYHDVRCKITTYPAANLMPQDLGARCTSINHHGRNVRPRLVTGTRMQDEDCFLNFSTRQYIAGYLQISNARYVSQPHYAKHIDLRTTFSRQDSSSFDQIRLKNVSGENLDGVGREKLSYLNIVSFNFSISTLDI